MNPAWLRRKWRLAKRRWPQRFSELAIAKRRKRSRTWAAENRQRVKNQRKQDYLGVKARMKSDPHYAARVRDLKRARYERMMGDAEAYAKHLAEKRKWYRDHKGPPSMSKRAYFCAYQRKRRASDPQFKMRGVLACRLRAALRGIAKADRTMQLVGCDIASLTRHIEKQWTEGMSWENYGAGQGKWSADHIKPCAAFNLEDEIEQKMCFHYSNLRPLWHVVNQSKGSRWNGILYRHKRKKHASLR